MPIPPKSKLQINFIILDDVNCREKSEAEVGHTRKDEKKPKKKKDRGSLSRRKNAKVLLLKIRTKTLLLSH